MAASSSEVSFGSVPRRQSWASSRPSKAPTWVWVLPMSTASSIGRLSGRAAARAVGGCHTIRGVAEAKLYVIPGSHPSQAARRMLEMKGIPYKRIDLIPVVSKGVVRAQGFPGKTVPALKIDGRRIQGTREIARALDEIDPDPPLFPADANKRASVEEAERWGDEVLQPKTRRVTWWALKKDRAPMASYSEGAKLGVPVGLAVKTGGPIVSLSARFNGCHRRGGALRPRLPACGPRPHRRLGLGRGARRRTGQRRRPADRGQPAPADELRRPPPRRSSPGPPGKLALRAVPEFPGKAPAVFPPEWLSGFGS